MKAQRAHPSLYRINTRLSGTLGDAGDAVPICRFETRLLGLEFI